VDDARRERWIVFGSTSGIAAATARILAARGADLFLVGRDPAKLEAVAADLRVRGRGAIHAEVADLNEAGGHEALVARGFAALGRVDGVLVAQGLLGDQRACERDPVQAAAIYATNLAGPALLAQRCANALVEQGGGVLVGLSSVAGDRGRQSNYFYGSAKAGFTAFLAGLRHRLHGSGVQVVTVLPGFVDTPMTAALPKNALFASPEAVAHGILAAVARRRRVAYLPGFWRLIMAIVRAVPEAIFLRTRL
jgi:short-subunit dehydrogenase